MATKKQYARWCMDIIEGDTYMLDDIYAALEDDGFTDENQEWIHEGEDEDDDE